MSEFLLKIIEIPVWAMLILIAMLITPTFLCMAKISQLHEEIDLSITLSAELLDYLPPGQYEFFQNKNARPQ